MATRQLANFALYPVVSSEVDALVGWVDGFPEEEHRVEVGVTTNPVESGSDLVDHAVRRPIMLKLTGFVSDLLAAPSLEFSPGRSADAWAEILDLVENRTLVNVVSAFRQYENMLITKAVAPRTVATGEALRFSLELQELLFSDTEITRLPPSVVDPAGPAADRTSQVDGGDRTAEEVASPSPTTRVIVRDEAAVGGGLEDRIRAAIDNGRIQITERGIVFAGLNEVDRASVIRLVKGGQLGFSLNGLEISGFDVR